MISLTDQLPKQIQIDGVLHPINWTYQTGILFSELVKDNSLSDEQTLLKALILFYPEKIPNNIVEAREGILWFFKGGQDDEPVRRLKPKKTNKAQYSFTQDAGLIYAAFMQAYSINLFHSKKLHWWEFRELLSNLPEDCMFSKVLTYRSISITGKMPKEQKEFYQEMKEKYRLLEPDQNYERINEIENLLLSGDIKKLKGGDHD